MPFSGFGFGSRWRYAYPRLPNAVTWGLRAYRVVGDTIRWLTGSREYIALDMQGETVIGAPVDATVTGSSDPMEIPWNHIADGGVSDKWDIGQVTSSSSSVVIRRKERAHCNGWWLWSFQANIKAVAVGSRVFVELICRVDNVEHIMARYEQGYSHNAGFSTDHLVGTSFVFDFSRFDPIYDIEIVARVFTSSAGQHDLAFPRLWGLALAIHPQFFSYGSYRWPVTPVPWTSGALTLASLTWLNDCLHAMTDDRVICDLQKIGAENVPNVTTQELTWDSEIYDPWGWHSLVANPSRITVDASQAPCVLLVMASFAFPAMTGGGAGNIVTEFGILKNGGTIVQEQIVQTDMPAGLCTWVGTIVNAVAGDYFQVRAYQSSGFTQGVGTLNLGAWFTARFVTVVLKPAAALSKTWQFTNEALTVNSPYTIAEHAKLTDGIMAYATDRPAARAFTSIARALADNTWTTITLDTEGFDHGGIHAGSDGFFTVPAGWGGIWVVSGSVNISGGDGAYGMVIQVNGVDKVYKFITSKVSPVVSIPPTPVFANAGQQIRMQIYQKTGGAQTYGVTDGVYGWAGHLAAIFETFAN